ncbi:MAG TPA: SCP2 sterol-binding domain-containing protein [Micromonosporaceae bacterium]
MTEAIDRFFRGLDGHSYDPVFGMGGTTRFEFKDGDRTERYVVTAKGGRLRVTKDGDGSVDGVLVTDAEVFDRVVRGELNAKSAMLRGVFDIRGDLRLFVMLERFMPGPANAVGPRHLHGGANGKEGRA